MDSHQPGLPAPPPRPNKTVWVPNAEQTNGTLSRMGSGNGDSKSSLHPPSPRWPLFQGLCNAQGRPGREGTSVSAPPQGSIYHAPTPAQTHADPGLTQPLHQGSLELRGSDSQLEE